MSAGSPGRVFLSYRRTDTAHVAGRLYDRLETHLGAGNVFMDVDSIEPGLDFAEAIEAAVARCDVLLALIGPRWVDAVDDHGRRRLEDPDDFVALEIATALDRGVRVIPVLVDGASSPRLEQLPLHLAPLARRQAARLDHLSFGAGATVLLTALDRALHMPTAAEPSTVASEPQSPARPRPAHHRRLAPSERVRLTHDGSVNGVVFGPDGTLLATSSRDCTARVWETATGTERIRITHDRTVYAVAFGPDGALLATAGRDWTARVWETATGAERARLTHDGIVKGVVFSLDGILIATACHDDTARVWETAAGTERIRLTHDNSMRAVAFSPDGTLIATASADSTARVWETATGAERARLTHDDGVNAVAFSPDGTLLATASTDHSARVWDVATGTERIRLTHDRSVDGVAFSPDGTLLATASNDSTARVWELYRDDGT